jgi:hypothetical protein
MRILIALLVASLPAVGCAQLSGTTQLTGTTMVGSPTGAPVITNVVDNVKTDTTIPVSFSTPVPATPGLACGLTSGTYDIPAKDNGIDVDSSFNHVQIVAGLTPSTTYFCQIAATNAAGSATPVTFSIATAAAPATTPITSITLGSITFYNSINASNQGTGDTFYNCKSNDGYTYMIANDTPGFFLSGVPSSFFAEMTLNRVTESPMTIQTFQRFLNFQSSTTPEPSFLSDGLSSKGFGLFCMDRKIFLSYGRLDQSQTRAAHALIAGNILSSPDHGASWNLPGNLGLFAPNGTPPNPLSSSMFPGSPATMGSMAFVKYGADDGTLGYFQAINQHDNGNAFVYTIFNEGVWNGGGTGSGTGGNVLYLARAPRAKLQNLSGSDWQWYKGSSLDGNLDSSWSSSESDAEAMLSNPGELGTPDVVYIPALNRYVLLTFYYPTGAGTGGNTLDCEWLIYEAPHPWGPWTLEFSHEITGPHGGGYNPIILADTAFTGFAPIIMWTENYAVEGDYVMETAPIILNH